MSLKLENVRISYGRLEAVHGIDLVVNQGEAVGVIGANGAGKSSALKAIFGIGGKVQGSMHYQGHDLVGMSPEKIARLGLALVPEGRNVFAKLTVRDNLRIGTTVVSDRATAAASVEGVLDRFPALRRLYKTQAGLLSGGEQQQLAIARSLVSEPDLLVLDEPSLGLAPQIVDQIFSLLDSLREEGKTILLAEQNAAKTMLFADRTYVFRTGSIAVESTKGTVMEQGSLIAEYLGGTAAQKPLGLT